MTNALAYYWSLLGVSVLVDESVDVVDDGAGVVANAELGAPAPPVFALDVVGVGLELGVNVRLVPALQKPFLSPPPSTTKPTRRYS